MDCVFRMICVQTTIEITYVGKNIACVQTKKCTENSPCKLANGLKLRGIIKKQIFAMNPKIEFF